MKKTLYILIIPMILMLSAITLFASSAISPIDTSKDCTLTIQYKYENTHFNGLEIKTYLIADVFDDGTYTLNESFKDYPVNIYGITSQAEWHSITTTLASYIVADKIPPSYTGNTDIDGNAIFNNIKAGMYLTLGITIDNSGETVIFEDFITVVPSPQDNGEHLYNVMAYPKCTTFSPTDKTLEYKIVKQWKDTGYTDKRPDSVEIDILKNGIYDSTQLLSSANNWTYVFTAPDDGSKWTAVERNVNDNYYVSVNNIDNTIIITNSSIYSPEDAPQTGNTPTLFPLLLIMSFSGIVTIIIAIRIKRT